MALSGNFHHYISGEFGLYCEWTGTQNAGGNYTDITLKVYLRYYNLSVGARTDNTVSINGSSSTFSTSSIDRSGASSYTNKLLTTKTVRVKHNADGTKTGVALSAKYHFNGSYGGSSVSWIEASTTVNLNDISVYSLSVSAGTHSSVTVNRTSSGYGSTGNISAGAKLYSGDKLKITFSADSGYRIATHTVNGTAFKSGNTHTVASNVSVVATASASSSKVGATDANIGSVSTITVTKGNSSYYHSLKYSFGGATGYITSSGGVSSTEVKFSQASIAFTVPTSFYAKIPNAKSGTCTITCSTYSSSSSTTVVGTSTCTFKATAAESACKPTVSGTVVDTNETTTALTGNSSKLVRYKSTARCTITATAKNSATISTKTVNGHAVTNSNQYSISKVDSTSFVFKATDSRGYSNTATVKPTVIPYVQLTCNPIVKRTSPTGSSVGLTFNGAMYVGSFGSYSNTLKVEYCYKLSTSASYNSWTTVTEGNIQYGTNSYKSKNNVSLGNTFDYQKSYDFKIRVTDGANGTVLSTVTKVVKLQKGIPVFDWGENDFCINVNAKGRVLGLGDSKALIASGSDMNAFYEPGVYGVASYAAAQAIDNCPSQYGGTLRVWISRGNDRSFGQTYYGVMQEYTDVYGNTYRRSGDSTGDTPPEFSWRKWMRVVQYVSEGSLSPQVPVTYDTTTASNHGITAKYVPMLDMCFVRGYVHFEDVSVSANAWVKVATVSSDYKPNNNTALSIVISHGGKAMINSSGEIMVSPLEAVNSAYTYDVYFSGWWEV